jgi:hypothetical protein
VGFLGEGWIDGHIGEAIHKVVAAGPALDDDPYADGAPDYGVKQRGNGHQLEEGTDIKQQAKQRNEKGCRQGEVNDVGRQARPAWGRVCAARPGDSGRLTPHEFPGTVMAAFRWVWAAGAV